MMNLVDITNSYARQISKELRLSPAHFIKVYSLGNSIVVHKKKDKTHEVVISNKLRPITDDELDFVLEHLLGDLRNDATISKSGKVVEIEAASN